MVGSHGEMGAASEAKQFRTIDVQGDVWTAFGVRSVSGGMRTAKHESTLRAHELAAATNAAAPAIGHVANPRRRHSSFRPRRLTYTCRTRDSGMRALFLDFFDGGGDGR